MTTEVQITFDCADPSALATFWAEALGYQVQPPPEGFDSWDAALEAFSVPRAQWNSRSAILPIEGPHPRIFFQRVTEAKTDWRGVYGRGRRLDPSTGRQLTRPTGDRWLGSG